MNWQEVKKIAREKLKPYCRVCSICNGIVCAGEVPGMGGVGSGTAFKANVDALNRYKLNLSTIHDVRQPDTAIDFFGERLSIPVMAAPITGTTYNMGGAITEDIYCEEVIAGCLMAGT
ncbi:MAG: alpha-hydroxy-acid oxidizing protein, partial [Candidatus Kryptonium sp.]